MIEAVIDEKAPVSNPIMSTPATVMVIRNIIREALSSYNRKLLEAKVK